jgi:hypothetical protein
VAYGVHLKGLDGKEIALEDWKHAVRNHALIRLSREAVHLVKNSQSREQIAANANDGDTEIWLEDSQSWVLGLRWRSGSATVNASRDFDDPDSFLRCLLRELAQSLNAEICGDEGEIYS